MIGRSEVPIAIFLFMVSRRLFYLIFSGDAFPSPNAAPHVVGRLVGWSVGRLIGFSNQKSNRIELN